MTAEFLHDAVERAAASEGRSDSAVYALVERILAQYDVSGNVIADIGCGGGALHSVVSKRFAEYVGCDLVRYNAFPQHGAVRFVCADLNRSPYPLPDSFADVAVSIETIEHLENPRALMREMCRITRPAGWVIVTTPNQLSMLSKLSLVVKNQFNAFLDGCYPAHITPLVEMDLLRIAAECGLERPKIHYTNHGRIPLTPRHWPHWLRGRAFSDNLLLIAQRASAHAREV